MEIKERLIKILVRKNKLLLKLEHQDAKLPLFQNETTNFKTYPKMCDSIYFHSFYNHSVITFKEILSCDNTSIIYKNIDFTNILLNLQRISRKNISMDRAHFRSMKKH